MTYSEQDLDRASVVWPRGDGSSSKLATKGRCMNCWGALIARENSEHGFSAIRCRVCRAGLSGRAAREEMQRIEAERAANLLSRLLGRAARVLLAEAEVVGIRAGFTFEGTRNTENADGSALRHDYSKIRLVGSENAPLL